MLSKSELFLHFQPIIRLPTLELAGFESTRSGITHSWALLPPTHFIPIAEGKIASSTSDGLCFSATETMTEWLQRGLIPTTSSVSVNVSPCSSMIHSY